jgi:hypothetical protein
MKNLILTLIITLPLTLWGQGWEQTFGEEYISYDFGQSVQQTTDGGYIITGRLSNQVGLIKTDENGDELWSQTFGGLGSSVQQTTDGGYIITGFTNSSGSNDILLIKTYGWGTEQWSKTFGGDGSEWGRSVQQTTDGGYIITGRTQSFGSGGFDVYLIKTDENGNEIWSQTFGGEGDDESYSVQQTTDGGFIITGYTQSFENGDSDFYLIKTDEDGEELWSQTFGGENEDGGGSVQQTTDGGFIITGYTQSFENGDSDFYLIKTDEDGEELWSQTFGGENDDGSVSVQQTTDGGYIITGSTQSFGSGNRDIYLIKTDENGNELWSQTFGGENEDRGFSVQQTTDGGYIITGSLIGDIYLIKTDEYGNILPYESILNGCDSIQSLLINDYIYESGTYINTLTNVFGGDSVVIQNFNIFDSPDYIVIEGDNEVFISSLESYQITISTNNLLEWNVEGGTISEVNGNTIEVLWGDEGIGYVEVTETDNNGCSTTSTLEVTISNEPTNIYEYNTTRKLIKTINLLGQEIKPQKNQPYIEIFDDGSVEKKIVVE